MSGGYVGSTGDAEPTVEMLTTMSEAQREQAKPTGAQINKSLTEIRKLVSDLSAQVEDIVNTKTYSRTVIDANFAAKNHGHTQDQVSGTWTKGVSTGGDVTAGNVTGANVFAQSIGTNITATRVTAWGRTSDGFLGTASSSERYKTNIRAMDVDPIAVLSIEPVYYQWIAQVEERERRAALPMMHAEYEPDMHVATEVGMIAERLHEAGLWQFVVYERDPITGYTKVDGAGQGIPEGIHYINWGVALQVVARHLHAGQAAQEKRIKNLEANLVTIGKVLSIKLV